MINLLFRPLKLVSIAVTLALGACGGESDLLAPTVVPAPAVAAPASTVVPTGNNSPPPTVVVTQLQVQQLQVQQLRVEQLSAVTSEAWAQPSYVVRSSEEWRQAWATRSSTVASYSISKSSVKFVGNARRTFVVPSIFAFAFTDDVEME